MPYDANGNQKKAGITTLHHTKYTLKQRLIKDKNEHYIMKKGSIQQEDITFVNIYAPT